MLRAACGSGDNLDDEDRHTYDEHNRLIDNYVMVYTYTAAPVCGVWERNECGHGCVRMDINDAKWIYDNMPYGTTVVVY
jgi:hypothetical protein